ncbi:MAG: hypothetical protein M0Z75_00955, partial [Nitrospiraceae bacterium]|nr:hypothetical protein [Nitrospiraceae bacterium]
PVIIGGKNDSRIADAIVKAAPKIPFADKTGKLDLPASAREISGARFLISNESGPAHLGVATGTKTFVIASGNSFARYVSYPEHLGVDQIVIHQGDTACFNCHGNCVHKNRGIFPCIENITVEQAAQAVLENLKPETARGL